MPSFTAALIAGGHSRRFGSDKARLAAGPDGEPLWMRQLGVLRALEPSRLLFSSRTDQVYELPGDVEWAPDEAEDRGPLEGIRRCLEVAASAHVLCLAVDLPGMTTAYLRGLLEDCDDRRGVVPRLGTHWEPLAAVYPTGALRIAEEQMAAGRLALQEFVDRLSEEGLIRAAVVSAGDSLFFHNVNTPEDWAG